VRGCTRRGGDTAKALELSEFLREARPDQFPSLEELRKERIETLDEMKREHGELRDRRLRRHQSNRSSIGASMMTIGTSSAASIALLLPVCDDRCKCIPSVQDVDHLRYSSTLFQGIEIETVRVQGLCMYNGRDALRYGIDLSCPLNP
jgi:hypothetical protein